MILSLLERESCRGVTHLEATVTPTNEPSMRLFRSLARRLSTQFTVQPCFGEELFPDGGHEEEQRIRVGPIANFSHQNGECSGNH